jgi:glycosyltransferase involved in cell wall biosynthesis
MDQRHKVLMLIPHLGGGGAERVTALLSRGLSRKKYELHMGLITESVAERDVVPSWVRIHTLGAPRVRAAALRIVLLVRTLQPDLILSGMAHLNFMVLLLRPFFPAKTRVVVRQNATVSDELQSGRVPPYSGLLYRLLYSRADRIVCQSNAMAADLAAQSQLDETHVTVLANPVDEDAIRSVRANGENHWHGHGPHLLAVGRLSFEKGFDLLLEALASLRVKFPDAQLTILGKGPELVPLTILRDNLHLQDSVRFGGYVSHPERFFSGATLFVLPSRQEGLPNAMLEAAAGGLPIVALPACQGVSNLLEDKNGVWIGTDVSSAALTRSLLAALDSLHPGQRFPHEWVEHFRMERAILDYERMIDEMLHPKTQREHAL